MLHQLLPPAAPLWQLASIPGRPGGAESHQHYSAASFFVILTHLPTVVATSYLSIDFTVRVLKQEPEDIREA